MPQQKGPCLLSGVYVNYERGNHSPHHVETRFKTANVTLLCGLVVFRRKRLEVSDGKPVYTKLSVSSGVNLLRSNSSTANNACDKHVSTLNLG